MEATIKKWGNSYAIRLTKRQLAGYGFKEGDKVQFELRPIQGEVDLSGLPVFRSEPFDHDEALYGRR